MIKLMTQGYNKVDTDRRGQMKKILRVNLRTKKITYEGVPQEYLKTGGRGLIAKIMLNEVNPLCDPLGRENKLIIANGLLTGTNEMCIRDRKYGEDGVYLEKYREYRSEEDVFERYTREERDKLFGKAPVTVWENISAFSSNKIKQEVLKKGDVFTDEIINAFRVSTICLLYTSRCV